MTYQKISLPRKYIRFGAGGITVTCPGCEDTQTYQIGQFDKEKWAMHRGNYWCKKCRDQFHPVYLPSFKSKSELDTLMDMI